MQGRNYTYRPVLLLMLLLLSGLSSCYKDLELPKVKGDRKISVLGELTAGDSVHIRCGQSLYLLSGGSQQFELLRDLSVTLADDQGREYPLTGTEDERSQTLYTLLFSNRLVLEAGRTYKLTATHSKLGTATAEVQIPQDVSVDTVRTGRGIFGLDSVFKIKINIHDRPAKEYYVIEALKQKMLVSGFFLYNGQWLLIKTNSDLYDRLKAGGNVTERYDTLYLDSYTRLPLFSNEANTEGATDNGIFNSSRRILLSDNSFNGADRELEVLLRVYDLTTVDEMEKGRVMLLVKSVSESYYRYLRTYEQSNVITGINSIEQAVPIESNISNGVGVLGGVSLRKFYFLFDTW